MPRPGRERVTIVTVTVKGTSCVVTDEVPARASHRQIRAWETDVLFKPSCSFFLLSAPRRSRSCHSGRSRAASCDHRRKGRPGCRARGRGRKRRICERLNGFSPPPRAGEVSRGATG
ncbi:hypothetical protein DPEC_G00287030 [Dallia pectoralis]|uniref:Uncharacterized protein n=1 Tax=Dallia pectoralis TaxID=75939 RepID=A0ACC2FKA3_DALPE|nr:hypothetical protein DPEC_G00287030 [Dallia pectoralis]